jgi:shikimate kinase
MASTASRPVPHSEIPPQSLSSTGPRRIVLGRTVLRHIVLTGFMGAGKTTVGQLLAQQLGWRFVDADDEIEVAAGATIAEIFASCGEPWFRELEHETIRRLTAPDQALNRASDRLVIALGGGAIEDDRTRSLLLDTEETRLIHLEASLGTVLDRCRGSESLRPVLQDQANLEARYQRRLPLYRQSHLTIAVDSLPPEAVAAAVLAQIGISSEA